MRIALTVDPELPVPPRHYGGIERIIDMLAHGLVERGHDLTLFAHRNSVTAGRLAPWKGLSSFSLSDTLANSTMLAREVARQRFDIVHSCSRISYLTPILPRAIPKLMTYHRQISRRTVRLGYALSRGTLSFSAVSDWMTGHVRDIGDWYVSPNGTPMATFDFRPSVAPDAPFAFLGRIEAIKGPHLAIDIARRLGRKLVIAGNIEPEHRAWFEAEIAPHIDGDQVRYIGPVDDAQKNAMLGQAAAFLMPILWEEPFGMVMTEAMACGTPVLALARGAAAEIVADGVTGFVAKTVDDLVAKAAGLAGLDRAASRARVETLYSAGAMTDQYINIYERVLASAAARKARRG